MQLLKEGEAAQRLTCKQSALRRMRREGRGPRFVRVGRLIRYRLSDLENFIEQNSYPKKEERKLGENIEFL